MRHIFYSAAQKNTVRQTKREYLTKKRIKYIYKDLTNEKICAIMDEQLTISRGGAAW